MTVFVLTNSIQFKEALLAKAHYTRRYSINTENTVFVANNKT